MPGASVVMDSDRDSDAEVQMEQEMEPDKDILLSGMMTEWGEFKYMVTKNMTDLTKSPLNRDLDETSCHV